MKNISTGEDLSKKPFCILGGYSEPQTYQAVVEVGGQEEVWQVVSWTVMRARHTIKKTVEENSGQILSFKKISTHEEAE